MSDRVDIKISVKPIEELTTENGTSKYAVSSEVNRNLGGGGSISVTDFSGAANVQGFADGAANYREAIDSADTTDISSEATASVVYIENTGFTYSDASTLGAALNASVKVMSGSTMISILAPGQCLILQDPNAGLDCTGIHVRTVENDGSENAALGHLAVKFLVAD